eukprot:gene22709-biopygen23045
MGVKALQGGHHSAEKYRPKCLFFSDATSTDSFALFEIHSPRASATTSAFGPGANASFRGVSDSYVNRPADAYPATNAQLYVGSSGLAFLDPVEVATLTTPSSTSERTIGPPPHNRLAILLLCSCITS